MNCLTVNAMSNTGLSKPNFWRYLVGFWMSKSRTVPSHEEMARYWLELGANCMDEITSVGTSCSCVSSFFSCFILAGGSREISGQAATTNRLKLNLWE